MTSPAGQDAGQSPAVHRWRAEVALAAALATDGVVCVRSALDPDEVAAAARGIDTGLAHTGPLARGPGSDRSASPTPWSSRTGTRPAGACAAHRADHLRGWHLRAGAAPTRQRISMERAASATAGSSGPPRAAGGPPARTERDGCIAAPFRAARLRRPDHPRRVATGSASVPLPAPRSGSLPLAKTLGGLVRQNRMICRWPTLRTTRLPGDPIRRSDFLSGRWERLLSNR